MKTYPQQMKILAIETSCDETAVSIIEASENRIEVLTNIISSQVKLHAEWGGVVPNLAAREHLKNILPVVEEGLREANITPEEIDLLAVTQGPGLIPALLIGTSTAKALSYFWKKPLIGIHHIEGHIYANFINSPQPLAFPALCLVVSGGHTQLVLMKKHLSYEIVGETLDDAVGEAFDKVARILGLGYPGGPAIAQEAEKFEGGMEIKLPRPMLTSPNLDFSFSGIKTAVLYLVKKNEEKLQDPNFIQAVAHEFQQAVIDVLVHKTITAGKKYNAKTVMLAGGVSANTQLRQQLGEAVKKDLPFSTYQIPDIKYSLDNASMIASAAYFRWQTIQDKEKYLSTWKDLEANPGLELLK